MGLNSCTRQIYRKYPQSCSMRISHGELSRVPSMLDRVCVYCIIHKIAPACLDGAEVSASD